MKVEVIKIYQETDSKNKKTIATLKEDLKQRNGLLKK